jgi:mono/diheme cytochrome c family protein
MIRRVLAVTAAVVLVGFASAVAADEAAIAKGKAVFDSAKPPCKTCHNEKKTPLDNFGATGTAETVKAMLRTPKEALAKAGKKGTKPTYGPDKISDADLEALTAYLLSLKKK